MNRRFELERLEADLHNARLAQKCRAGQAHMREKKLEHHQEFVRGLLNGNLLDRLDDEAVQEILDNIRAKCKGLDI